MARRDFTTIPGNINFRSCEHDHHKCHCIACGMSIGWPQLHFSDPVPGMSRIQNPYDPRAWLGSYCAFIAGPPVELSAISGIRESLKECFKVSISDGLCLRHRGTYIMGNEKPKDTEVPKSCCCIPFRRVYAAPLLKYWNIRLYTNNGYPIHEGCWILTKYALGYDVQKNLDLVLKAMLDSWRMRELPFGLKKRLVRGVSRCTTHGNTGCIYVGHCEPGDKLCLVNAQWNPKVNPALEYTEPDPYNIPKLREDIKECEVPWGGEVVASAPPESPFLPLNVKVKILGFLDPVERAKTLEATRWKLPRRYGLMLISSPEVLMEVKTARLGLVHGSRSYDWAKLLILEGEEEIHRRLSWSTQS